MASYTQYWKLDGSGPFNTEAGQSIIEPVRNKYYLTNSNSTSSSNPGTEVFVTDPNAVSSAAVPARPPNAVSSAAVPAGPPPRLRLRFQIPNKDRPIITDKNTLNGVVADRPDIFGGFEYRFTLDGRELNNTTTFEANGIVANSIIVGTYTLDSIIKQHLSKNIVPNPITTLFYFDAEFQAFNMADSAPFAHTPPSNGAVKATHFILNMGHICLELEQNRVSQSMSIAPLFVDDGKFRDPTILLAKYIIANDVAWPEIDKALKISVHPDLPAELRARPTIELHKLFRRTDTINRCISSTGCTKDQRITAIRSILLLDETDNTYPFLSELLQLYPDKKDEIVNALRITHDLYMKHSFDDVNTALIGDDSDPLDYFDRELYELHKQMRNPHTLLVCKGKTDLYAIYNTFQRYGFPVMSGELQCAFFNLDMPRPPMTPKVFPIMKLGIISDLYKLRYGLTQFYDDMQYMYVTQYLARIGSTRIVEHNPLVDSLMHMMAHIGFSFDVNGSDTNDHCIFNMIQRLFGIPYSVAHATPYLLDNSDLTRISYGTKIVNGVIVFKDEAYVNTSAISHFERQCLAVTPYFMPLLRINIEDIYIDPSSGHEFTVYRLDNGTYRIKNITTQDNLSSIIYKYVGGPPHMYELDTVANFMPSIISIQRANTYIIPNSIVLKRVGYTANDRLVDVTYIGKQIIRRNNGSPPEYRDIYVYNHYYYIVSRYAQDSLDLEPLKYGVEIIPPSPPPGPPGHPRRRKTRRQRRALKSRRRKSRKAQ